MFTDSVLKKIDSINSFNRYINLLAIHDSVAVGVDGSLTVGFLVGGFDYFLAKDKTVNDVAYACDLLLNLLDEDISLQWLYKIGEKNDKFILNYENSSFPPKEFEYIKRKKLEYLRTSKIRNVKIYLFCSLKGTDINRKNGGGILKKLKVFNKKLFSIDNISGAKNSNARLDAEGNFEDIKKSFANIESNLSFFSSRLNISFKRMNNEELTEYFYEELNPERSKAISAPQWKDMLKECTFRSQLMFSAAEIKKDYFYLDRYYYKFINMHRLPSEVDSFGITKLLNIENKNSAVGQNFFPYTVQTTFNIPDQEKVINKIQTDRNIKASLTEAVNGGYIDYKGTNITAQLDDFLESVSKMQKKVVQLSLTVGIKALSLEELDSRAVGVLEAFKNLKGMEGIVDNMEHHNLFLSFLPGHSKFNRRFKTCISPSAAAFFPLHESYGGTESCAIPLINNREEGVSLDLYNNRLPAKHGIIFGKTRSGKGFMLNGFLTNFFLSDKTYHIVGVDIGGTYSKFCKIFNGDYIELSLDGNYCLNPFPAKKYVISDLNGEEIFDPDEMVFLIGIIGLMVEPERNLSPNDKTIIKRAIQAAYDKIGDENDMPIISDINNILFDYNEGRDIDDKKRAMEMGKNLFQWTDISSPYNLILNRKGSIDINKRIIIFDLQKLKGHEDLQKIVFAIIKNISFKKMYNKSIKVFFFYDECWEFMNDPKIAELIMHLYKTSAKWGGMVWSVTQEPGDLLKAGNIGKSIIENSTVKVFCQLDSDASENDLKHCGLSDKEIGIIKDLKVVKGHYAEYFLKFGYDSSVIKNKPSSFEYWLYCKSSDDDEIEKKVEKSRPNLSLMETLEILADEYPNGPYGIKIK